MSLSRDFERNQRRRTTEHCGITWFYAIQHISLGGREWFWLSHRLSAWRRQFAVTVTIVVASFAQVQQSSSWCSYWSKPCCCCCRYCSRWFRQHISNTITHGVQDTRCFWELRWHWFGFATPLGGFDQHVGEWCEFQFLRFIGRAGLLGHDVAGCRFATSNSQKLSNRQTNTLWCWRYTYTVACDHRFHPRTH